ncbi:MAG: hypothetical protein A3J63_02170 [Candidatus Moranbacteria bacterium RIFCSPHIGHO2_02_FULL_40_12b]|nr:MAG: hypothetical protein A3J63_02170 [Candidatus Moranbacteria bacterium RIFCSPHIGHO2_02_FULL_40_12b]OGI23611.1 MAG: hypothetical protein A3E91_01495 [Candidatus Moranbacteria bacterium RIFCSPHIGHO2_12_FULL_40_10]
MSKRSDELYLSDIRNSIGRIEKYSKNMAFKEFARDWKTIDAITRNISIIGEAAQRVSKKTKDAHPEIPWRKAIGMRNKVIHEYFGVNDEILWKTIKEDLPVFKKQIAEITEE